MFSNDERQRFTTTQENVSEDEVIVKYLLSEVKSPLSPLVFKDLQDKNK